MSWSIRSCAKCAEPRHMHATRKICVDCRNAEGKTPEAIQQKKAQQASARATKAGKLVRQPCMACAIRGAEQRGISQGHHEDYSRPLDVIWLCAMHHRWVHKGRARVRFARLREGRRMKPRIRIKAISQFVQATPHETAVAQAPPRPAPSATAVSVSESALERAIVADTPTGLNTSDPSVPVGVNFNVPAFMRAL